MELQWLASGDEARLADASDLFDSEVRPDGAADFLNRPGHHVCLAYRDGAPVGFVSGVEMTHPDKGTEMFLYELGVAESVRRTGVGTALVSALAQRAQHLGCYGMWVLTDHDNEAALRTYAAGGATLPAEPCVMLSWSFPPQ